MGGANTMPNNRHILLAQVMNTTEKQRMESIPQLLLSEHPSLCKITPTKNPLNIHAIWATPCNVDLIHLGKMQDTVVGIPTGSRAIYVSSTFFYATSSSPRPSATQPKSLLCWNPNVLLWMFSPKLFLFAGLHCHDQRYRHDSFKVSHCLRFYTKVFWLLKKVPQAVEAGCFQKCAWCLQ